LNKTFINLIYSFFNKNVNYMKNEIVRKLTSLTLMTIMFAGGLTFAFPGIMPDASAAHNSSLFVSGKNTFSSNTLTGPMVAEVVVSDSSISSQDDAHGEPTVTVNGRKLRMLQATDGNWYAYIADVDYAKIADATQPGLSSQTTGVDSSTRPGKGLNFGKFCRNDSGDSMFGFSVSTSEGIAIPSNATSGHSGGTVNGTDGTASFVKCTASVTSDLRSAFNATSNKDMNVIRENKTLNRGAATGIDVGQLGLRDSNYWPFIQLYDFVPTGTVVIKYDKPGGTQTTTLTFDTMSGISLGFDRTLYPADSQVHVTLQDFQLNIDPTDEDSWTWGSNIRSSTTNKTVFYMLFNDTGSPDADGKTFDITNWKSSATTPTVVTAGNTGAQNLFGNLTTLGFEDNGMLTFNNNTSGVGVDLVKLVDTTDMVLFNETGQSPTKGLRTQTVSHASLPITFTETAPNSGIFTSTDEANNSMLRINDACTSASLNVCRGKTAQLAYDDVSYSILVGTSFATVSMDESAIGGEWNSGETIDVTLVDNDQNLNSKVDEDLDVNNKDVSIFPAVKIGSPITLASENATYIIAGNNVATPTRFVFGNTGVASTLTNIGPPTATDSFSDVLRFGTNTGIILDSSAILRFNLTTTGADLKAFLANGTKEGTSTLQQGIYQYLNYDLRSLETNGTAILSGARINFTIYDESVGPRARIASGAPGGATDGGGKSNAVVPGLAGNTAFQGLIDITRATADNFQDANTVTIDINFTFSGTRTIPANNYTVALDLFRFGTSNDGDDGTGVDRFNDAIYRLEIEETGLNTGTFEGSVEYIMLNQLNANQTSTFQAIAPISNDITIVAHEDLTDEDAVRVNYNDLAGHGSILPTADQQAAPTHSGVVSFDFDNYKIADTVTVTLTDQDLNVDSEIIDIFTVVQSGSV